METEYELTPDEVQEVQSYVQVIIPVQNQLSAVLRLVIRQRKLEGEWSLNMDGTKLTRKP